MNIKQTGTFMKNRRINSVVITGPTGAIGYALCNLLLEKGIKVYGVVRPSSSRINSIPKGVEIIKCDISNYSNLPKMIADADAFVHLAWSNTFGEGRNDMPSQIANIQYAIDAVNAASVMKCNVFVGAGSQAEYGRVNAPLKPETPCFPENGYGMAKLCAGEMTRLECDKLGIDHIWMRILSVYGPHDNPNSLISYTIDMLKKGEKPILTKCEQIWDYLYSDDAAMAFLLALMHGKNGAVYPLGSGNARPLKEYLICLRNIVNPKIELQFGEREYSDKQVMCLKADISKLKSDTGFSPKKSFEEVLNKNEI